MSVCKHPANKPAHALLSVVAATKNAGETTTEAALKSAALRTAGKSHAPPKQHRPNTPTSANVVDLRIFCAFPNVPNRRTELSATSKVLPSWRSTASHSGNAPVNAGNALPKMETTASVMFCFNTRRVFSASAKTSGSCEMPSASACRRSTSAAAAAASDGVDATATPTSAAAKAGASLIPSPTIATRPYFGEAVWFSVVRALSTNRSFSEGVKPACTSSPFNPTAAATARADVSLSPVSIITRIGFPSERHDPD